jgi:hypothetical protein
MSDTPVENSAPDALEITPVPRGAMVHFSETVADLICGRMAEGETLRQVCRDPAMPSRSTVYRWLSKNPRFRDQYARARELLVEAWADEIIDIADDGTTDYVTKVGRNGHEYEAVDQEHIQRSRLRVDARRWLLSKLNPGQYGDHMEVQHTGEVDHRHHITDDERIRRLALFLLDSPAGSPAIDGEFSPVSAGDQPDCIQPEHDAPDTVPNIE